MGGWWSSSADSNSRAWAMIWRSRILDLEGERASAQLNQCARQLELHLSISAHTYQLRNISAHRGPCEFAFFSRLSLRFAAIMVLNHGEPRFSLPKGLRNVSFFYLLTFLLYLVVFSLFLWWKVLSSFFSVILENQNHFSFIIFMHVANFHFWMKKKSKNIFSFFNFILWNKIDGYKRVISYTNFVKMLWQLLYDAHGYLICFDTYLKRNFNIWFSTTM